MKPAKIKKKIQTAFKIWNTHGLRGVSNRIESLYRDAREKKNYQKWIEREKLTAAERLIIRQEIENLRIKPLVSVVMPVYNVDEKWLRLCIESVLIQLYENWELCIADDCSPSPHIRKVLEEYAARDKRIKVVFRASNGHISAASNSALELASGEFAALLDHDDELAEDALYRVAKEINDFPQTAFIYSDEDLIDENNRRYSPKFKPNFSRDLFYSLNLITHLSVYRTKLLREIGGFRLGFEGSQDYDLALRVIEKISENQIRHIPRILYHWRAIAGSVALASEEKPYAHERARQAIRAHLERTGKKAFVTQGFGSFHRIRYDLPVNPPKTILIISVGEDCARAQQTIADFAENTNYRNFEIFLIGTEKLKRAAANQSFAVKTRILVNENQSVAERFNFAAAQTDAEILCFVSADLRPNSADWLAELAGFAIQTEIGAVGAKILSARETILGSGLIIGTNETVSVAHYGFPGSEPGNLARAQVINNFSGVSISCLTTRRDLFLENGGFDAINFPERFFDADFCLRLREKNYRIVFTPHVELTQTAVKKVSRKRKKAAENENSIFREKWKKTIVNDPFYNPNLSRADGRFLIGL